MYKNRFDSFLNLLEDFELCRDPAKNGAVQSPQLGQGQRWLFKRASKRVEDLESLEWVSFKV